MVPVERVQQRAVVNACNEQIVEVPLPQNTENVVQRAGRIIREAVESRCAVELSIGEVPF